MHFTLPVCGVGMMICTFLEGMRWGHIPNYFWWENRGSHFLRYRVESVCKADSSLLLFNPSVTPAIYLCLKKNASWLCLCTEREAQPLYNSPVILNFFVGSCSKNQASVN